MKGMPKFNDTGNLITKKPEPNKVEELEKEFENQINEKEVFHCKYCDKEWDNKQSNIQHERWCPKGPNPRKYRSKGSEKPKAEIKPKEEIILQLKEFTVEELRRFDKIFGLTDKEIIDYIRGKKS